MATLTEQRRLMRDVLAARDTYRAARHDFARAVKTARDGGVDEGLIADELLRDSVRHGEATELLHAAGLERAS